MFEIGKEYHRRSQIHGKYKGQQQGGISTPKNFPYIFLFTSEAGEQHGYKDEFRSDGIFWYTGEGQHGDMTMSGGNKAIRYHKLNSKSLFLFEYTRDAHVRFIGEAEYLDHHEETRPDTDGNERIAFIFHLMVDSAVVKSEELPGKTLLREPAADYFTKNIKDLKSKSLEALKAAALQKPKPSTNRKTKRQITYYRSEALKLYVLARSQGLCEGCNENAPFRSKNGPFLECHHVYRLADGGPDHPRNVVALCPNCHRRAHYAVDAKNFNKILINIARTREDSI